MSRKYRVFISCVSSEFGMLRDRLSKKLGHADADVEIITQDNFSRYHESPILIDILYKEVKRADVVICIQGKRSGFFPEVKPIGKYAKILRNRMDQVSYTQWEQLFAIHYRKKYFLYRASESFICEQPNVEDFAEPQVQFLRIIDSAGILRREFKTEGDIFADLLTIDWRRSPPFWAVFLSFASFVLVFCMVSFALLGASAMISFYSDTFSRDVLLRPPKMPSLTYFIAGDAAHTMLIAKPTASEDEISLKIPRALQPFGCTPAVVGEQTDEQQNCSFEWPVKSPGELGRAGQPYTTWPFWEMNTVHDFDGKVNATLMHNNISLGAWSIVYRDASEGGPCLASIGGTVCLGEHYIGGSGEINEIASALHYGRAELRSTYENANDNFDRAASLAIFGFSLLISWMEREVLKIDRAFSKVFSFFSDLALD